MAGRNSATSFQLAQGIQDSLLTLTSDNEEFFDAVSDLASTPPDDFQSDTDDDGDVYVPTFAESKPSPELEPGRSSLDALPSRSRSIHGKTKRAKHLSDELLEGSSTVSGIKRCASDGGLLNRLESVAPGSEMQKSKSDSAHMDDVDSSVTKSDNLDDNQSLTSRELEETLTNGGQMLSVAYR